VAVRKQILDYNRPVPSVAPEQPARLVLGLLFWAVVILIALATLYIFAKQSMAIVLCYLVGVPVSVLCAVVGLWILPPRRRWYAARWFALPLLISVAATAWLAWTGAKGVD
jgi:hypothetical protein